MHPTILLIPFFCCEYTSREQGRIGRVETSGFALTVSHLGHNLWYLSVVVYFLHADKSNDWVYRRSPIFNAISRATDRRNYQQSQSFLPLSLLFSLHQCHLMLLILWFLVQVLLQSNLACLHQHSTQDVMLLARFG